MVPAPAPVTALVPVPAPVLVPYLDHRKHSFPKSLWENLAFLHSKLFHKEKIDYFHQIHNFILLCLWELL
jgi:hypothetical protein